MVSRKESSPVAAISRGKRSAVMHLEFLREEAVAFEALIQKCKSASHGRRLKGGFVRP